MKIFISFILFISCVCFAQKKNFNKEAELQKFVERGGKVEETEQNIYKLTYPDGMARVYNFNQSEGLNENFNGVDTTIINMWEIDTTKYNDKFSFWQKVDIYNLNYFTPPLVDDLNRNGIPEIYGRHNLEGPVEIYERNDNRIFTSIYTYSDSGTVGVSAMGEIHGSGEKELYIRHVDYNNGVVYKSDSIGSFPTTFDFIFYYEPNQINDMALGDFDNNEITDCIFMEGAGGQEVFIAEFRDSIQNFETVFHYSRTDQTEFSGFTISDFDNDGKTELVFGTGQGNVYVIENVSENIYEISWQDTFSTLNAYMKASTNDIDGNGKPEFWIGGQDFVEGISRFQCYEAVSDNNYETVALIELRYINSLYTNYLQAKDVDGDGKQELIISLANVILILKFAGSPSQHRYKIYYAKIGEATQPGAEFEPLTLADLDGDNKTDILLPFNKYENGQTLIFSYILRNNLITGIEPSNTKTVFTEDYIRSYPVPFNSTSSINFYISRESPVVLKIYNSLGKEIKTLLDKKLSPGEYNIQWEAEDKYGIPLPSGIYFINLHTDYVVKTTKTILLK